MDPRNLYTFRYRKGSTGVVIQFITASSPEIADELGKHLCGLNNWRFIKTEPAVMGDESMLPNLEELKEKVKARQAHLAKAAEKEAAATAKLNAPTPPVSVPDARGRAAARAAGG